VPGTRHGRGGRRHAVRRLRRVDDVLGRAQALFDSYEELARAELPPGSEIVDVHTHLGHDIDGMVGDYEELLRV
jgi:hypothetical protein